MLQIAPSPGEEKPQKTQAPTSGRKHLHPCQDQSVLTAQSRQNTTERMGKGLTVHVLDTSAVHPMAAAEAALKVEEVAAVDLDGATPGATMRRLSNVKRGSAD